MINNRNAGFLFVAIFGLLSVANAADQAVLADIEEQRKVTREQIKEIMSQNLKLSSKEADGFWGVYGSYQDKLKAIHDKELALIAEYADAYNSDGLDDEQSIRIVEKYLNAEIDKAKIRKKYLKKFKRVLPPKKVAIFYQVDNRIDAIVKIGNAAQIPLITAD